MYVPIVKTKDLFLMGIAQRYLKVSVLPAIALASVFAPISSSALASAIDALKPHRAVYDITLVKASDRSGMQSPYWIMALPDFLQFTSMPAGHGRNRTVSDEYR